VCTVATGSKPAEPAAGARDPNRSLLAGRLYVLLYASPPSDPSTNYGSHTLEELSGSNSVRPPVQDLRRYAYDNPFGWGIDYVQDHVYNWICQRHQDGYRDDHGIPVPVRQRLEDVFRPRRCPNRPV
jgi:hypothetical protein